MNGIVRTVGTASRFITPEILGVAQAMSLLQSRLVFCKCAQFVPKVSERNESSDASRS